MHQIALKPALLALPLAAVLVVCVIFGLAWGAVVAMLCRRDRADCAAA